jgi:hypothetical protein
MASRSRRRRDSNAPRPELARQDQPTRPQPKAASAAAAPPVPEWKWKTFPVFFAFAAGGFVGLYLGVLAQATDNQWLSLVVFTSFAMLLGWALSRFVVRWMMLRRIVKPRSIRRAR